MTPTFKKLRILFGIFFLIFCPLSNLKRAYSQEKGNYAPDTLKNVEIENILKDSSRTEEAPNASEKLINSLSHFFDSHEKNIDFLQSIILLLLTGLGTIIWYYYTKRDKKDLARSEGLVSMDPTEISNTSNNSLYVNESNLIDYQDFFISRDKELEELHRLLVTEGKRQVTLYGAGGMGKTRLAHYFGSKYSSEFKDGVRFVDLREATTVIGIVEDLLKALGTTNASNQITPIESVVEYLKDKSDILIIMDNFEQVSEFYTETIEYWCKSLTGVRFLITSREKFYGRYETPVFIDSLSLESSKKLLYERCKKVRGEDDVKRLFKDKESVEFICLKLDGIPLAIEIVSAQTRPPCNFKQIRQSLEAILFFRMTTKNNYGKHETLFQTIDWSFQMLTKTEKEVFLQLSIFKGGCDLLAYQNIINSNEEDSKYVLDCLIDKSLLKVVKGDYFDRVQMYVAIYDFASKKLNEKKRTSFYQELVSRWSNYYIQYVEKHNGKLHGEESAKSFDLIELELENMYSIQFVALENSKPFISARAILAITQTLSVRGPTQLRIPKLELALKSFGNELNEIVLSLNIELAKAYWADTRWDLATFQLIQAKNIASRLGKPYSLVHVYKELGKLYNDRGYCSRSRDLLEIGLKLYKQDRLDDKNLYIELLTHLGTALEKLDKLEIALKCFFEAEDLARILNDKSALGQVHNKKGLAYWHHGRIENALLELSNASSCAEDISNNTWRPAHLTNYGLILGDSGQLSEAISCFEEASILHNKLGYKHWAAVNYAGWGRVLMLQGGKERLKKAKEYCEIALKISEKIFYPENLTMHFGDLARISVYHKDYQNALRYSYNAICLENKLGSVKTIRHFSNLATFFMSLIQIKENQLASITLSHLESLMQLDFITNPTIQKIQEDLNWIEKGRVILQEQSISEDLQVSTRIKFDKSTLISNCKELKGSIMYPYPWYLLEENIENQNQKEILLFTYGSLLNKSSAIKTLSEDQYDKAKTAIAFGIKRMFNYNIPDEVAARPMYQTVDNIQDFSLLNVKFSGLISDFCNGLVISIPLSEIENLRKREIGYDLVQTKCYYLSDSCWEERPVFALSCEHKLFRDKWLTLDSLPPHKSYLELCAEGARSYGDEFFQIWRNTTFLGDGRTKAFSEK
ncbi:NB-ARC domain-containing protein [Jiulongibacter sediminis]|uniref:NB-ARC domain-containing protein n=1 Tax=Jiulongibacter sediminis TaxID=1605367 RepID=UPI0026F0BBAA|nr:NB-ARC domain-containing protein [Jiulongibacter sediminis]